MCSTLHYLFLLSFLTTLYTTTAARAFELKVFTNHANHTTTTKTITYDCGTLSQHKAIQFCAANGMDSQACVSTVSNSMFETQNNECDMDWFSKPCNRLEWVLDKVNRQQFDEEAIYSLQQSLTENVDSCWLLKFKVYHKLGELFNGQGNFTQAFQAEKKSFQEAQFAFSQCTAVDETRECSSPVVVITPALALINLLHLSGPGAKAVVREQEDHIWTIVEKVSKEDRSLRIRAASHVSFMLSTKEEKILTYRRMLKKLKVLLVDPTMDCLYFGNGDGTGDGSGNGGSGNGGSGNGGSGNGGSGNGGGGNGGGGSGSGGFIGAGIEQCQTRPQNYTSWYPTYPIHYHLLNAKDIVSISKQITTLYKRSTRSLLWVAPNLRQNQINQNLPRALAPPPLPPQHIKIGFISAFLYYDHSLGQHISGVIQQLHRNKKYEITLIHLGTRQHALDGTGGGDILISDFITERNIGIDIFLGYDITQLATQRDTVSELKLDIIVYPEIGLEANAYFLSFSRLAPIQVATWCFPQSLATGAIDYFISSDHLEPDETAAFQHYDEQLVQFSKAPPWYFYKKDAVRLMASPAEQNMDYNPFKMKNATDDTERSNMNVYFIPQDPIKLHYSMNRAMVEILKQDCKSIIVLMMPKNRKEYLLNRFKGGNGGGSGDSGDSGSSESDGSHASSSNSSGMWFGDSSFPSSLYKDRIILIPRTGPYEFRRLLSMADVILDSWPWGGWTTTLQALSVGSPVITLPGYDARSRFAFGVYQKLKVYSFIAKDVDEYIKIALRAGNDKAWTNNIMKNIDAVGVLLEDKNTPIVWDSFFSRSYKLLQLEKQYNIKSVGG